MTLASDTAARPMRSLRGRRLRRAAIASLGAAVCALVAGVVYASLTLNGSGTGFATTGTVTLGSPTSTTCSYANLTPGSLTGSGTCTFGVTYSGSIPAFLSLTVQVQSSAGAGGAPLYDGTNTAGLTLSIGDGHRSFAVPTGAGTTGGGCPAGSRCWTAANDLAAWYAGSAVNLTFSSGNPVAFTVTPVFATASGNRYQGGRATVTLTVQAVQSGADPLPAGCTAATVGQPCPAGGTFAWS